MGGEGGAGEDLRRIDSCITQLKAQGPSRTCNESREEKEEATNLQHHTQVFLASMGGEGRAGEETPHPDPSPLIPKP